MASENNVVREGISVGLIGAVSIAAWFAIIDAIQGHMFATPVLLGTSLGSLVLQGAAPSAAGAFLGYTVFHFTVFMLVGVLFALIIHGAERTPSAMFGFGMLFVAFEVGWIGWTMVLSRGLGELTWLQVFIANLIATATMSFYMWRQHPTLPKRVTQEFAANT